MLPYPTDDSHCLVDLIGVPIKWTVNLVLQIQQVITILLTIFKNIFYVANTFNVGHHVEKTPLQKERQRKSVKCVAGYQSTTASR
jgi:hypothetical protein